MSRSSRSQAALFTILICLSTGTSPSLAQDKQMETVVQTASEELKAVAGNKGEALAEKITDSVKSKAAQVSSSTKGIVEETAQSVTEKRKAVKTKETEPKAKAQEAAESLAKDETEADELETQTEESSVKLSPSPDRLIVGWVEKILVGSEKLLFNAKLTPGSEGNVFHAKNIEKFKKGKEEWVKFEVSDRKGKEATIEKPLNGEKRIKSSGGKVRSLPEVKLEVCLASVYMELEFGLEDRSKFDQEVRIGREALAGNFYIDPSVERSKKPKCKN